MFILVLMSGREYQITASEYDSFKGKAGVIYLPRLNLTFNMASISSCDDGVATRTVDRTKQLEGVAHDGTRCIKQFGRWFDANGARDESGKLCVELDPDYYPEMKTGILPTPEEYEKTFKFLPDSEWMPQLIGMNHERPIQLEGRTTNQLEKI